MQNVVVFLVIIACLSYVGWRIYEAVRSAGDPCYGCDGCEFKGKLNKKRLKRGNDKNCPRPSNKS